MKIIKSIASSPSMEPMHDHWKKLLEKRVQNRSLGETKSWFYNLKIQEGVEGQLLTGATERRNNSTGFQLQLTQVREAGKMTPHHFTFPSQRGLEDLEF